MTILSPTYFLFVPIVWLIALALQTPRQRQVLLLVASYFFYATSGLGFLAILIVSSAVNFAWGRVMRRSPTVGNLWVGIGFNALILIVFKYLPSFHGVFGHGSLIARIAMPLGVSFWTFQAISYLSDLYREEELDPTWIEFFLFMAFWPVVISGPVCRMTDMLEQYRNLKRPSWADLEAGFPRVIVGLFLKLIPAQILINGPTAGEGITAGFDQLSSGWGGLDVWALAFGFGFYLFFDFAGYSHVVIGTGRLFGLTLPENFNKPYLATTPSIFWTRWHMSLSSWIRDYIFIPMAPMRREQWWRQFVLAFTMVLFGLWHAATWPFLIWGVYHGIILVLHRQIQALKRALNLQPPAWLETPFAWGLTIVAICFGWIFFHAHDVHQIGLMTRAVLTPSSYRHLALRPNYYIATFVIIASYFLIELAAAGVRAAQEKAWGERLLWLISPAYYAVMILLVIAWSRQEAPFVYFAF